MRKLAKVYKIWLVVLFGSTSVIIYDWPILIALLPSYNAGIIEGGKDVDDMQDELKDMLFGEQNSKNGDYIGKPIVKTTNNLTQSRLANQRKVKPIEWKISD